MRGFHPKIFLRSIALCTAIMASVSSLAFAQTAPPASLPADPAAPVSPDPVAPDPVPPAAIPPVPVPPPATPTAAGPVAPVPTPSLPANPVAAGIKVLRSGPLLIHGNYCGLGNRPGKPPIDALDEACMHHDACTQTGKFPSCACDDKLRLAATAIAEDPATPPDIKAIAVATAGGMAVLVFKNKP